MALCCLCWAFNDSYRIKCALTIIFKTLNALLKIFIRNTFPTQQYKTVQSLL